MTPVEKLCAAVRSAAPSVAGLDTGTKNRVLCALADRLLEEETVRAILEANSIDMERGRESHMPEGRLDRLLLNRERLSQIAEGVRQVALLPDPIGEILEESVRPNGLHIRKVRVPLGVIGIIYESRPNVTADAFALTLKTGNAVVLKGGSDAIASNLAIVSAIKDVLSGNGISPDAVDIIASTDRKDAAEFMSMREYIDVLIPRGSAGLIRAVVEGSRIPVIETGSGNCHIYVDESADLDKAVPIIINAKTQRIGVCNAAESLVVHEAVKERFLPLLLSSMNEHHVELRADEESIGLLPGAVPATEKDFGTEYLDYILSVKTVSSLDEAIRHINRYHTGHSDAIITEDEAAAERFLNEIDSACVYVNASTRFTDGFEFGFGAEIGISTQKLHARGPMGLRELTSYKYKITGNGQVRA